MTIKAEIKLTAETTDILTQQMRGGVANKYATTNDCGAAGGNGLTCLKIAFYSEVRKKMYAKVFDLTLFSEILNFFFLYENMNNNENLTYV